MQHRRRKCGGLEPVAAAATHTAQPAIAVIQEARVRTQRAADAVRLRAKKRSDVPSPLWIRKGERHCLSAGWMDRTTRRAQKEAGPARGVVFTSGGSARTRT